MSRRDWHADGERLDDDLAAYALGALDPGEAGELEHHLDDCKSCRERVDWLRPAVDVLPASVQQRTPPESLREDLLATVRAEAAASESRPGPARAPWWQGLRAAVARPAVAMTVLIVLTLGVAAGYLIRGSGEEMSGGLVSAKSLGPQAAQVSATLERHGDSATLHVQEMPELDPDEVYEVWVQRAGVMEPRSTFVLGMDGGAEAAVPGPLGDADAVFVTAEPRPGSRQPTTEPLLEAPLG
ncbi:MAG: anti-sigma factor domain-containing protein [Solirubrobacterales bacterium]